MRKALAAVVSAGAGATILAAVLLGATGCEEGTGTSGLTISPQTASISFGVTNTLTTTTNGVSAVAGRSVVFTVTEGLQELSLPLKWTVSNPALGTVTASGGSSAVYSAITGRHGVNSITVQDQYGAVGVAQVDQ